MMRSIGAGVLCVGWALACTNDFDKFTFQEAADASSADVSAAGSSGTGTGTEPEQAGSAGQPLVGGAPGGEPSGVSGGSGTSGAGGAGGNG